jgi:predicted transcriptional regulator of viral defense system
MRLDLLSNPEFVVFTTRDYAQQAGVEIASASRQLGRAQEAGALTQVTRGIWANTSHPSFHALACVAPVLGNEQGYVSFLTALHLHDVISQIPRTLQVATTGRPRTLQTPVGTFELFRLAPSLMREGIAWSRTAIPYRIASSEKALLDTLYLSTRRGRRFRSLPELDLEGRRYSRRTFQRLLDAMENPRLTGAVRSRATELGLL